MPPKKKTQGSSSSSSSSCKEICCVCCQSISTSKDEYLFCNGVCQSNLHRYCAGVSNNCYKVIKENTDQFFCFVCSDRKNQRELASLRDTVRLLTQDIDELKLSLSQAKSQLQPPSASEQRVLDATQPASPSPSSTNGMPTNKSLPKPVINASNRLNDKRFNLVVYGINESQKGTPRHKRLQSDLERVVSVMSGLVSSINSASIKDLHRLGKFNTLLTRPRPILVKFIRAADVMSVLSNRRLLTHPISIKPDLSQQERKRDSLLLKERWILIQSGCSRHDIKIRESRLYVKNKLYGCVNNSKFMVSPDYPVPTPTSSSIQSTDSLPLIPKDITLSQHSPVAGSPIQSNTNQSSHLVLNNTHGQYHCTHSQSAHVNTLTPPQSTQCHVNNSTSSQSTHVNDSTSSQSTHVNDSTSSQSTHVNDSTSSD